MNGKTYQEIENMTPAQKRKYFAKDLEKLNLITKPTKDDYCPAPMKPEYCEKLRNYEHNYKFNDDIGITEAFNHYRKGNGETIRIDFNDIDTSEIVPSSFKEISQAIEKGESKEFNDIKIVYHTKGKYALILGRITLSLNRKLHVNGDDRYFDGILKSYDDIYDFNPSDRNILKELSTLVGRIIKGDSYYIQIRGEKKLTETGTVTGFRGTKATLNKNKWSVPIWENRIMGGF